MGTLTCILEGILGWHHLKCIWRTPSLPIYLTQRGGLFGPDPDVGSLTGSWKGACTWTGHMACRISSIAMYYAARLCSNTRVSFHRPGYCISTVELGSLQKGNVQCVAQVEIILISREGLNLKVEAG